MTDFQRAARRPRYLDADDDQLAYYMAGRGENPVLWVHGFRSTPGHGRRSVRISIHWRAISLSICEAMAPPASSHPSARMSPNV